MRKWFQYSIFYCALLVGFPVSNVMALDNRYLPAPAIPQQDPMVSSAMRALQPQHLSLKEAIVLALRMNPQIQTSELQRVIDKFNLVVAHNEFEPQYQVGVDTTLENQSQNIYGLTTGFKVKSPIGTNVGVDYNQGFSGGPGVSTFKLSQPILKGFGEVNKFNYLNSLDSEKVAQMTFQENVMLAVDTVITSYRALVQDYKNLDIQKTTIAQALEQVRQAKLQFKAGKMARSELTQVSANLSSTQLAAVQQQNTIQQDYQNFLQALGLMPTANLVIDREIDYQTPKVPSLLQCINLALVGNIQYQQALVQINSAERAVKSAKNGRLPELDVTVSGTMGSGGQNTHTGTTQGPFIPVANNPVARLNPIYGLNLDIPLDDVKSQQALIDARVGLEQAKIRLKQQKENLIRTVMTQWNQLQSQKTQIEVSEQALALQAQSLNDARLKLKYGRTTAFELTQLQNQLLQAQTNLVSTKIAYLNGITALEELLGITLDKWNIKLRY